MNTRAEAKISESLVILGTVLFVGGAMCYVGSVACRTDLGNRGSGAHLRGCRCGHDKGETVSTRNRKLA